MRLVFSAVFEQDFEEMITRFAAEASTEVARRFEHSTYKLIETLLQHPKMGRMRTDLIPDGIRSFRVPGFDRYLLFYQMRGNDLVLLRLSRHHFWPYLFISHFPAASSPNTLQRSL